jgi:hypothetical protein
MKKLLTSLLFIPALLFAQTTAIYKYTDTTRLNQITGPLVFPTGQALTMSAGSTLTISGVLTAAPTSGTANFTNTTLTLPATAIRGAATLTFPTTTSTLATLALAETLSNKTLASPIITGTLTIGTSGPVVFSQTAGQLNLSASTGFSLTNGDLFITALKKVYLDSGGDTYLWESSADNLQAVVGGTARLSVSTAATTLSGNLTAQGTGTHSFGGVLSFSQPSGHAYMTGPTAAGKYLTLQSGNTTGGVNFRDSLGNEIGLYNQSTGAWGFVGNTTITGNAIVSGLTGMGGVTAPNETLEVGSSFGRAFFGNGGGATRKGLLIQGFDGTSSSSLQAYNYQTSLGQTLNLNVGSGGPVNIGNSLSVLTSNGPLYANGGLAADVSNPSLRIANNRIVSFLDSGGLVTSGGFIFYDTSNVLRFGAGNTTYVTLNPASSGTLTSLAAANVFGTDPGGSEKVRVGGALRLQGVVLSNSSDTLTVANHISTGNLTSTTGLLTMGSSNAYQMKIAKDQSGSNFFTDFYFSNHPTAPAGTLRFFSAGTSGVLFQIDSAGNTTTAGNAAVTGTITGGSTTGSHQFNIGSGAVTLGPLVATLNIRSLADAENPEFKIQDSRINSGVFIVNARTGAAAFTGPITASTTISAGSTISSTLTGGLVLSALTAGTGNKYLRLDNTGGTFYAGIESSGGGTLATSTGAYYAVIATTGATGIDFATAGARRLRLDNAGVLTLTGSLTVNTGSVVVSNGTLTANNSIMAQSGSAALDAQMSALVPGTPTGNVVAYSQYYLTGVVEWRAGAHASSSEFRIGNGSTGLTTGTAFKIANAAYSSPVLSLLSTGVSVTGNLQVSGSYASPGVTLGGSITTGDSELDLGYGRSGSGNSFLDLIGDTTYTDYGLRLIRGSGGANANSQLIHRGTGGLAIIASEVAPITLSTTGIARLVVGSGGQYGFGNVTPLSWVGIDNQIPITAASGSAYLYWMRGTSTAVANADSFVAYRFTQTVAKGAFTGLNSYGILMDNPTVSGAGTITDHFAIRVLDQTIGTNNYAIYTGAGLVRFGDAVSSTNSIFSSHPTAGIGYATGAGSSVTQTVSKTTTVSLNTVTGKITMHAASLAAGATVIFQVSNTAINITDHIIAHQGNVGTIGAYSVEVVYITAGNCQIAVKNISGGALAEAIDISFAVIKGRTS